MSKKILKHGFFSLSDEDYDCPECGKKAKYWETIESDVLSVYEIKLICPDCQCEYKVVKNK